ncbi:hypothetical protein ACHWQZ_G012905 [Mnemiopsis leidyi]
MFLNYVLRNSAWRRGLLKQREMYLAGETRNYPVYCPVQGCGNIRCHDHRERDDERNHHSFPKDDYHYKFNRLLEKIFGMGLTYYVLMKATYNPEEAMGHDWNNYEYDDWEFYADAQAESDPSKAKFVSS